VLALELYSHGYKRLLLMGFLNFQTDVPFLSFLKVLGFKDSKSFWILLAVVLFHLVFLWVLSKQSIKYYQSGAERTTLLKLIYLPQQVTSQIKLESIPVKIASPQTDLVFLPPKLQNVEVQNVEVQNVDQNSSSFSSDAPFDLSDKNNQRYKNIFDPKMRKKLIEAQSLNQFSQRSNSTSRISFDGKTYVSVGNGDCMVSMEKMDNQERGTNWSTNRVKCGQSDEDKMMENINADIESRKQKRHE
jgi:hypothetical protein